jgi:hypothetical protein
MLFSEHIYKGVGMESENRAIEFVAQKNSILKFTENATFVKEQETDNGLEIVSAFREWLSLADEDFKNMLVKEEPLTATTSFIIDPLQVKEIFRLEPNGDLFYKDTFIENDLKLVKDFHHYTACAKHT